MGLLFLLCGTRREKDPGLPPLRVLRESSGGALRLAHMALGDPHVMALMHSLDHLPSLTSIDVADNRCFFWERGRTFSYMRSSSVVCEQEGVEA